MGNGTEDKYIEALRSFPASGGGGAHSYLLTCANLGKLAGLTPKQVEADLRRAWHGEREATKTEFAEAISKAFSANYTPTDRALVVRRINGENLLAAILKRGQGATEDDIRTASPVKLTWPVGKQDAIETLRALYAPDDLIFVGDKFSAARSYIRAAEDWIHIFERTPPIYPHIVPNPLTGERGLSKTGTPSWRADGCVSKFKFATLEFDQLDRQQQIEFWAGCPLPICALIDSGGKSIHAWVRIDAENADDWEARVERKLFSYLKPLGIDGSNRNESRLSRLPGHFRSEKKRFQRLLYLSPEGKAIR